MHRLPLSLLLLLVAAVVATGFLYKTKYHQSNNTARAGAKALASEDEEKLQNGDLIFHTSQSAQSKAIQLATNSPFSHCGIVYKTGEEYFVYEAVQPVSTTPLAKWVARGEGGHYVVKRLKKAREVLTPTTLAQMQQVGQRFAGKDYDLYFGWSDDRIYCSELIWKIYQRATGLEIGKLEKLQDFDLSALPVQAKMKERYGNRIPYQEQVISPASMFHSPLLETVVER